MLVYDYFLLLPDKLLILFFDCPAVCWPRISILFIGLDLPGHAFVLLFFSFIPHFVLGTNSLIFGTNNSEVYIKKNHLQSQEISAKVKLILISLEQNNLVPHFGTDFFFGGGQITAAKFIYGYG